MPMAQQLNPNSNSHRYGLRKNNRLFNYCIMEKENAANAAPPVQANSGCFGGGTMP